MKKYLGSIAAIIAVLMLTAVSSANARGSGGGGGGFGGSHGGGFSHGGEFGGGHGFAGRGFFGHGHYYNGHGWYGYCGPGWFGVGPYWWSPYYYGDYYDSYGYLPPDYYDNSPVTYYSGDSSLDYPPYDGRDYLMLGYDSGRALRMKTVSEDWLVEYLRVYIINVPLNDRDGFRQGFTSGYGDGATSVLKKAIQEARHPPS